MTKPMTRFQHGGDVYTHAGVVDFSANINPLGMPREAREALVRHVEDFEVYPDAECRVLRRALARVEKTSEKFIVCTAGASDLFQRICLVLQPRTALVTAPCFSGYEQVLEQVGARIVRHALLEEDNFDLVDSPLRAVMRADGQVEGDSKRLVEAAEDASASPDLLFLCNPNNPSGRVIERSLLERIIEEAQAAGIVVVLDECFLDFTGEPSAVGLCPRFPNLIIARAFTKMYAMAGLRIGYGICSDENLIERIAQAGQPWAVSGPAQVAAFAALDVPGWVEKTRAYVDEQREVLMRGLIACGLHVVPGRANYLLFKSPQALYEPLLECGFLIRRCGNFQGLDESWYRIAVRTAYENKEFLEALRAKLKRG